MDILIRIRTSRQAAAAVNKLGLNRRQVRQLVTAIAREGTIEAVVDVAKSLGPQLLLEVCKQRMHEISVARARKLLCAIPPEELYREARALLLAKYLRQPIRNWIYTTELMDMLHIADSAWRSPIGREEITMCANVVLRSQLPVYASEFLTFSRKFPWLDESMKSKLRKLADKHSPSTK